MYFRSSQHMACADDLFQLTVVVLSIRTEVRDDERRHLYLLPFRLDVGSLCHKRVVDGLDTFPGHEAHLDS